MAPLHRLVCAISRPIEHWQDPDHRRFVRDHPPSFDEEQGFERHQIIGMQLPALSNQRRFYNALLFEIGAPHSPKAGVAVLKGLTKTLLTR